MVNSFIAKEGPRQRVDRRPQRVRVGREQPHATSLLERVLSTAYLWHNYGKSHDRRALRHRERADRPAAGLLPQVLPARQRDAGRRRQVRRAEDARADQRSTSARIPKPARTLPDLHRRSRRRTASERSRCAASATFSGAVGVSRARPARTRTSPRSISSCSVLGDTPSGRLYKALVETKQAQRQTFGGNFQLHDPGSPTSRPRFGKSRSLDAARDDADRDRRRDRHRRRRTPRKSSAPHQRYSSSIELALNSSDRVGSAAHRMGRAWATGGCSSCTATAWRRSPRKTCSASAASTSSHATERSGLFIPTASRTAPRFPPTPDVVAMLKDYKGGAVVAAGEAFDPSPANIESRTSALRGDGT